MGSKTILVIYRALLQSASTFDKAPILKVLISSAHHEQLTKANAAVIATYLNDKSYFWPDRHGPHSRAHSVLAAVKQAFREESAQLLPEEDRIDSALQGLRLLNGLLAVGAKHKLQGGLAASLSAQAQGESPPLEQAQQEKAQGIKLVKSPAKGTVLLSHPLQQVGFRRSVILLSSHKPYVGSHGLTLAWDQDGAHPAPSPGPFDPAGSLSDQGTSGNDPGSFPDPGTAYQASCTLEPAGHSQSAQPSGGGDSEDDEQLVSIIQELTDSEDEDIGSAYAAIAESEEFLYAAFLDEMDLQDFPADERAGVRSKLSSEPYEPHGMPRGRGRRLSSGEQIHRYLAFMRHRLGIKDLARSPHLQEARTAFPENTVRMGGPVGAWNLLHNCANLGGRIILPARADAPPVLLGGALDKAKDLAQQGKLEGQQLHCFTGDCLWFPGQLDQELQQGMWTAASVTAQHVHATGLLSSRDGWNDCMRCLGGEFAAWQHFPSNVLEDIFELNDSL
ncbi:hypothetical protein WJX73_002595 [Symbiochloris irregularis]|uniref:Uncharacterized protein n=1 Tax=Symbiochloris irregularis TaxID=706552 RepID=A0AAW1P7Z4_9CHLO